MPARIQTVKSYVRRSPSRYAEDSKPHVELRAAYALDRLEAELSRAVEEDVRQAVEVTL